MRNKKFHLILLRGLITPAVLFIFFFNLSNANDIKSAEIFIQNLSDKIILIVENDWTVKEKQDELHYLFEYNASVKTISRAALGSKWRVIDKNIQEKFTDSFTRYLVRKYGKQFEEFNGAKLVIEKSVDAGKKGILVYTRLIMPATSPISVKWQVWQKNSENKLLDIIIEDISMLTMEREEIKNRLEVHNGKILLLINDLEQD